MTRRTIHAAKQEAKPPLTILSDPGAVTIEAAAAGKDGSPKLPRFSMVAYTGGPMRIGGWRYPVVLDLAGLQIPSQSRPVRFAHEIADGVGHTDRIAVEAGNLVATGLVSRDTAAAKEVVASAKNGFPWQASIGTTVDQYEFVAEEQSVVVNGRDFKGPLNVVRKATLREISFVDLGADSQTSVRVAAQHKTGETSMLTFEKWLEGQGFVLANLDETQQASLRATYDAENAAEAGKKPAKAKAAGTTATASGDGTGAGNRDVDSIIAGAKAERERQRQISAMIEEAASVQGADLEALDTLSIKAIADRMPVKDLELAILRLTRPRVGSRDSRQPAPPTQQVLEAALCLACGVKDERLSKDRDYGEAVVEHAWKLRGHGLHGIFAMALAADGIAAPHGGRELYSAVVEHARNIRAGYSSVSLPGLLGNVANKVLLDSFTAVNATYERIAQQADFSNFHRHTIYRLDQTGEFAVVGPTGEIKHGKLGETSYTNKLDTRGQMLVLPRQAVINDDTNALTQLTSLLGRKAKIAVEKALYGVVMEASDVFYTSGRGNKITSNPLGVEGLAAAEAALVQMVDADGDPVYAAPAIVLVPAALKYLADMLYTSAVVSADATTSGTAKQKPTDNPFRGRFRVESSPFMALAAMTGSSASGWYLLADPNMLPAFQVAYLNGQRSPTIESSDAEFNTLGIQLRAYFDFGVAQLDYRGCVSNDA